ncbi:PilZ domain-containing protein [Sphingomonas abietis]|uniref:PilZ domain-containing protein n=1 Tax=Sphingomonas abietis TaxID=3012344 RepID=A0ABY7NQM6_9SPHN|nr:PilZ domain-containing protein [Sphingomonas abietis]WBO23845.1 PilZ domain-containing protein [Sphingomonas abietis]
MLEIFQTKFRPRETRRPVHIPSRMRSGAEWMDVCIRNVSSRGLLVESESPPAPGTYVDLRRGSQIVIGRVVWRNDRLFGVRAQDRIEIDALIKEPRLARPAAKLETTANPERRSKSRADTDQNVARRLERSRQLSSAIQFALIAVAGISASAIIAAEVYNLLKHPIAEIDAALSSTR